MSVDYNHSRNLHTLNGAHVALKKLFGGEIPASLLDVGCGTGTWLRAAADLGVVDIQGIDGVPIASQSLLIPADCFRVQDLTQAWNLQRRYDTALCLEVAEHLDSAYASSLVANLVAHADKVYFSAACPGQLGQHHVNCQWPEYWQRLFNSHGYTCSEGPRLALWDETGVEPWYRQNMFLAVKRTPSMLDEEPRIARVIHPNMLPSMVLDTSVIRSIENGSQPSLWYLTIGARGLWHKLTRVIGRLLSGH
jgi:cyclopropane fatty-acyl-phospholipid synthase-like methyltransferase